MKVHVFLGLCLGIFLFSLADKVFSATASQAYDMYVKILKASQLQCTPRFIIVPDEDENAAASGCKVVVLTTGMLKSLRNNAELASVIGHEVGHIKLGHISSSIPHEYAADAQAAIYMQRLGLKVCVGAQRFLRRGSLGGDDHPTDIDRYRALGC